MSKTIQDYLGSSATLENGNLTVNINDLYAIVFPEATSPQSLGNEADIALAVLLAALDKTARPISDENGLEVQNPEVAITSSQSFQGRTFETRGGNSQIKYEFVFNVYQTDNTGFDPAKVV